MGSYVMGICVLLFSDALAAHALTRIIDLGQGILSDHVARTDNADANSYWRTILAQPAPCGREHAAGCPCQGWALMKREAVQGKVVPILDKYIKGQPRSM